MKRIKKVLAGAAFLLAAASAGFVAPGCGGGGGGGAAPAVTPQQQTTKGTLKLNNLADSTIVTIDGQASPASSSTVMIELTPGTHLVSVSRMGYVVTNPEDFAGVNITSGNITEHTVGFAREAPPTPTDWVVARPMPGQDDAATGTLVLP